MPRHISNAEARITHSCTDFFLRLESIEYGDFRETNPKITVKIMLMKIQPNALNQEMFRRVTYDETLEKDVKRIIEMLAMEVSNGQTYVSNSAIHKSSNDSSDKGSNHTTAKLGHVVDDATKRSKNLPPLCL